MQSGQAMRGRRLLEATLVAMDHEATVFGRGTLWQHGTRGGVLALLGRNDEAITELHTAIVQRYSLYNWWHLEIAPAYDKLRKDPRFQDIVTFARAHAASERQAVAQLRASNVVPDRSVHSKSAFVDR